MNTQEITEFLKKYDGEPVSIMEVCGTHTAVISESGLPSLLSGKIRLISGPGCPVCVTVSSYIDKLISLAKEENKRIVTFGDMIRVPGSVASLADIIESESKPIMVYSPFDIISLAKKEPEKTFVFAAVGFETTTPIYALLIKKLVENKIENVKILTALKTMPAAVDFLCTSGACVDGFIAPGNVCVITGSGAFEGIAKKYSVPFAVGGFSGAELAAAVCALVKLKGEGKVVNLYSYAVSHDGNLKAKKLVSRYFEPCDAAWRGMGTIKNSGLVLKKEFAHFDAGSYDLTDDIAKTKGCICGEIVSGKKAPGQCPLFGRSCTPSSPQGACMVSKEGACFHYYINKR